MMAAKHLKFFHGIIVWLKRKNAGISQHNLERGFNLIELMIVVTIVGILAAVAIPSYMSYIQQSRVVALVFPGLHSIETNVALHYSTNEAMPTPAELVALSAGADTRYFHVAMNGGTLKLTIDAPTSTSKLYKMNGMVLNAVPTTEPGRIVTWVLSGSLANRLGIND